MTAVNANQVVRGVEFFGDDDAPLALLAGGTTMLAVALFAAVCAEIVGDDPDT